MLRQAGQSCTLKAGIALRGQLYVHCACLHDSVMLCCAVLRCAMQALVQISLPLECMESLGGMRYVGQVEAVLDRRPRFLEIMGEWGFPLLISDVFGLVRPGRA
jgi:hypothetical protein